MSCNLAHKARHYFHHSDLQRIAAERSIAQTNINKSDSILDIGCGDGKITASLSLRTQSPVLGVDIDEDMYHFAQIKYPNHIYKNLIFKKTGCDDISDIEFTQKFHKIFAFNVLHLATLPYELIRLVKTLLMPGGIFIATLPGSGDSTLQIAFMSVIKKYQICLPYKQEPPLSPIRTVDGAKCLLRDCRFNEMQITQTNTQYAFIDSEEFRLWLKGTNGMDFELSPESEQSFYNDLVSEYINLNQTAKGPNGSFRIAMNHIHIMAFNQ